MSTDLQETVLVTVDCPNPGCDNGKALMATTIRAGETAFACTGEGCETTWWAEAVEPDTCFVGFCGLPPSHDEQCRTIS